MVTDAVRSQVAQMLKRLKPLPPDYDKTRSYKDIYASEQFPVPELVLFTLRDVLGLKAEGAYEKTRWGVSFEYKDAYFSVAQRKSGFTLTSQVEHSTGSPLVREVLGKLGKAVLIVERFMEQYAREQARAGRVTLANRFTHFDRTYRFFRDAATQAYEQPRDQRSLQHDPVKGTLVLTPADYLKPEREGGYFAEAMMNAYFSRTEHLFVLALAFVRFDPSDDNLVTFIGEQWSDKMRTLFDLSTNQEAKTLHDRVKRVRDTLRNPLAHGGFEPNIGSLYFHLPRIGAIPARMTRRSDGFDFLFTPIEHASFQDICSVFDDFDEFLRKHLRYGWRWAESMLDVAFDEESRRKYTAATSSDEDFEQLIRLTGLRHDRHVNFEY